MDVAVVDPSPDFGDPITNSFCADANWNPKDGDIVVLYSQFNVCFMAPFAVVKNRVKGRRTFEIEPIEFDVVTKKAGTSLGGKWWPIEIQGFVPAKGTGKYKPTMATEKACYFYRGKETSEWRVKAQGTEELKGVATLTVVPFMENRWYRAN